MLKLEYYRLERGLNKTELAKLSGVSRPFISQIESKRHIPRVDILCKLCKGLDVTPNDIIEEEYWKKN